MLVHALDEAAQLPEGQMQTLVEVVGTLSERPEQRVLVDLIHDSAPKSPLMLGGFRVGGKPGESSWRGHWSVFHGHQHHQSCLRATTCPQASEAASALRKRATRDWCQGKSDGKNDQKVCERQERVMVPWMS